MDTFLSQTSVIQLPDPTHKDVNLIDDTNVRYYSLNDEKIVEFLSRVGEGSDFKFRLLNHTSSTVLRATDTSATSNADLELDLWFQLTKLVKISKITCYWSGKCLIIPELYMEHRERNYLFGTLIKDFVLVNDVPVAQIDRAVVITEHPVYQYRKETIQVSTFPNIFASRPTYHVPIPSDYVVPEIDATEITRERFKVIKNTPDLWLFYSLMHLVKGDFIGDSKHASETAFISYVGALLNTYGMFFNFCSQEKYSMLAEYWMSITNKRYSLARLMERGMTKLELMNKAREKSREHYRKLIHEFIEWKLIELTMSGQILAPYRIAQVLFFLIAHRYITIQDVDEKGKFYTRWYEFVDLESNAAPNELYKWRQCSEMVSIKNVIYFTFLPILESAVRRMQADAATGSQNVRYNPELVKLAVGMKKKISENDGIIQTIIGLMADYMNDTQFLKKMDNQIDVIGVGNGVLELPNDKRSTPRLIRGYHNYILSKYTDGGWDEDMYRVLCELKNTTPICSELTDPNEIRVREMLHWWFDSHYEHDAAEYRLFYLCTTLSERMKPGFMFQIVGNGQRGKTTGTMLMINTLGPEKHANPLSPKLLMRASFAESANSHSTALMQAVGIRYGAMNESPPDGVLDETALKNIFSQGVSITGRRLRKDETSIKVDICLELTTNFALICRAQDWGTMRRIKTYTPKFIYVSEREPDPNNPFERKATDIYKSWANDPDYQTAWLTILSHYYARYWSDYRGNWDNVPLSPTIEKETWAYRISQNPIYKFACECVVRLKEDGFAQEGFTRSDYRPTTMNQMVGAFQQWFIKHYPRSLEYSNSDKVEGLLRASVLEKYLQEELVGTKKMTVFAGIRVLTLEREGYELGSYKEKYEEPLFYEESEIKRVIAK